MSKKGTTKYHSNKQEKKVAKDLGGKTVVASGALWHSKADVRLDRFLVECKTTEKSTYILSVKTWEKIKNEALRDGMRIPLMQVQLENGKRDSIAILSIHDFLALGLDQFNFVMMEQPILLDQKSYRVNDELLSYTAGLDLALDKDLKSIPSVYYMREDIKFVDFQVHLVLLKWDDFLKMMKEVDSDEE